MNALALIDYCRQYAEAIFVRVEREAKWVNLPISELTPAELLDCLERWILSGATPVRLIGRAQT